MVVVRVNLLDGMDVSLKLTGSATVFDNDENYEPGEIAPHGPAGLV